MASLLPNQLQQILDINSKSVEIYLEVNNQYEDIIKLLEDIKEKENYNILHIERINEKIKIIEEKVKEQHTALLDKSQETITLITAIDKSMHKQNWILSSSLVALALAIVAKMFGVSMP
ncbi:MAG: hypothetical protein ACOYMA_00560 [Bacteroidia bacterium]